MTVLWQCKADGEMNINPTKKKELTRVSLNDVDLFSEWEIGMGWEIETTQLSAGDNNIGFDHFGFPEMLVGHFCAKQSMQHVFTIPDGMVVFMICRTRLPFVWCGKQVPPTLMAIARSGREQWDMLPAGWDAYEFMVSEELIRRTEIFPPDFFAQTMQLERAFLQQTEPVTSQFLQRMDDFFRLGRGANGSRFAAIHGDRFFDFIIDGLSQIIDSGLRTMGSRTPQSVRRPDLVVRARDYIVAHLGTDFSIDEMARSLEVSNRVLNYAFRDTLGVSPLQYVLTQKLHWARRQLKSSEMTVTQICHQNGFNTPSRFTRQYFRLFGELPSATRYPNGRLKE